MWTKPPVSVPPIPAAKVKRFTSHFFLQLSSQAIRGTVLRCDQGFDTLQPSLAKHACDKKSLYL